MNGVRKIWEEGRGAVLGWLHIPSTLAAETLSRCGYDGLVLDLQHGGADIGQAADLFRAIDSGGIEPFVRCQENRAGEIMKLLDLGAYGVIAPLVETAEEARAFAAALHYPPRGERSFGPRRPPLRHGADYAAKASETIVSLAMIETRRGVDNLEAILAVEGYDGVFIGPSDLALALGLAPRPDSDEPRLVEAIAHIRERTHAHGKRAGIFCASGASGRAKIAEGFDLVSITPDLAMLADAARRSVAEARAG